MHTSEKRLHGERVVDQAGDVEIVYEHEGHTILYAVAARTRDRLRPALAVMLADADVVADGHPGAFRPGLHGVARVIRQLSECENLGDLRVIELGLDVILCQ